LIFKKKEEKDMASKKSRKQPEEKKHDSDTVKGSELPPAFHEYLRLKKELDRLNSQRNALRDKLQILEHNLIPILQEKGKKGQTIDMEPALCDRFGNCIGLRACVSNVKEPFTKAKILESLTRFFREKYSTQNSPEAISNLATETAKYLWDKRSTKEYKSIRLKYENEDGTVTGSTIQKLSAPSQASSSETSSEAQTSSIVEDEEEEEEEEEDDVFGED
jgi:hypothetical protein